MPCTLEIKDGTEPREVVLRGEIDEDFDAGAFVSALHGDVRLHLDEVRAVNSCGVREWISAMNRLPADLRLRFAGCSVPVVKQFSMIANFRGPGTIETFYAPYYCEGCDAEFDKRLDVTRDFAGGGFDRSPAFDCEECGEALSFDSLERVYFSFLREEASA